MNRRATQTALGLMLAMASLFAHAQATNDQGPSGAVPAATGLDTTTQLSENPPLSGLDQPSFEPGFGARSYLAPRAEVSEAADSNGSSSLSGTNGVSETTRALGSVELQKLWKIHPFDLDYVGGVDWYDRVNGQVYQLHSLAATQRFLWRTGQLALRDSFSYLPEGTFGFSSFGGTGGFSAGGSLGGGVISGGGIAGGGGSGIFSSGQFGSIGNQPRVTNSSIVDVTQYLGPRSSVVLAGGYGWTDFLNNPEGYINSQQTTAQAGYNYQLTRRDQVGMTYGFEELHFPKASAGSINVNVWQLLYGHRISGKLNLVLGGGPEWLHVHELQTINLGPLGTFLIPVSNSFITGSARATLSYRASSRTSVWLGYMRYVNAGSGFFSGANTDAIHLGVTHSVSRHWSVLTDGGYSRSTRLLSTNATIAGSARDYHFWYMGGSMRRQLGRQFGAFASYQYNAFGFVSGFCTGTSPSCRSGYGRSIGLIGLDWTPHPIRLD